MPTARSRPSSRTRSTTDSDIALTMPTSPTSTARQVSIRYSDAAWGRPDRLPLYLCPVLHDEPGLCRDRPIDGGAGVAGATPSVTRRSAAPTAVTPPSAA